MLGVQGGMLPRQGFVLVQTTLQFETLAAHTKSLLPLTSVLHSDIDSQCNGNRGPTCCLPMGAKKSSFQSRKTPSRRVRVRSSNYIHSDLQLLEASLFSQHDYPSCTSPVAVLAQTEAPPAGLAMQGGGGEKPPNLELVSYQLTRDLTNIFMQRQNWDMYHTRVELRDNLRGLRLAGLDQYKLTVNLLRLLAHVRFVYVRMSLLSVSTNQEEASVKVRWSIRGLGVLRFILRYFPDRLWEKGSLERMSPSYLDGVSTFYCDSESKIVIHQVDWLDRDQERPALSPLARLVELARTRAATQPAV